MKTYDLDASPKIPFIGDAASAALRSWQDMGPLWKPGKTNGQIARARDVMHYAHHFDSFVAVLTHSASCLAVRTIRNGGSRNATGRNLPFQRLSAKSNRRPDSVGPRKPHNRPLMPIPVVCMWPHVRGAAPEIADVGRGRAMARKLPFVQLLRSRSDWPECEREPHFYDCRIVAAMLRKPISDRLRLQFGLCLFNTLAS